MNTKTIIFFAIDGAMAVLLILTLLSNWRQKKRCSASAKATLLRVKYRIGGLRSTPSLECEFSYRANGVEYKKTASIPSLGVVNMDRIKDPEFEIQYNPDEPEEFWIDGKEKRRLGRP